MRSLAIPFAIWVGVLQLPPSNQQLASLQATATLLSAAMAMAGLTVMVYRLGVWRQEMVNTKHNIGAEIARYREETNRDFDQLNRRLDSIEHRFADLAERLDHGLGTHERELTKVQQALAYIDPERAA